MEELEALVALNMSGSIGSLRLNKLLRYFDRPGDILGAPAEKISAIAGITPVSARRIAEFDRRELEKEFSLVEKFSLKVISLNAADYPLSLRNIPDPPIVLYVKGELNKRDALSIAVVGSRRASFYGLECAEKFSAELAQRGFTVVSGMARGIDTAAHQAALEACGRTVAVIGSGFANIYPQENMGLAEKISLGGAVISEFPMQELPLRQNFPRRNRLISGLSLGVLVVEAARNSGALITADFALEQGREVFAVPGKIGLHGSFGVHELIKQGAKLVSSVEDITDELTPGIFSAEAPQKADQGEQGLPGLSCGGDQLVGLISRAPVSFDEIAERSGISASFLAGRLMDLQLKGLIKELPGKSYARSK